LPAMTSEPGTKVAWWYVRVLREASGVRSGAGR
jgi:hypothetical protein